MDLLGLIINVLETNPIYLFLAIPGLLLITAAAGLVKSTKIIR